VQPPYPDKDGHPHPVDSLRRRLGRGPGSHVGAWLITGLLSAPALASDPAPGIPHDPVMAPELAPAFLEAQHAVVGEIVIDNANIFDLSVPEENRRLYRLTNRLHALTHPKIIRRQLLFHSGEPFEARLLEESERILRSNVYLRDAQIEPLSYHEGIVDILVRTTDVWTLDPRFSFGRAGGVNTTSYGIRDSNLLGSGIYFGLYRKNGVDRDSSEFRIADRELGNTWFGLEASYADNSDGNRLRFSFQQPFYSLDARRSSGLSLESFDQVDSLYDRGEVRNRFRHLADRHEIFTGFSRGLQNGWVNRYLFGLAYDSHRFGALDDQPGTILLPENRRFIYPYLQWELVEDRFEETRSHDQIGVTEDRFLGTRLGLRLGYAAQAFGSFRDALIVDAHLAMGFGDSETDSLVASADYHSRFQSGGGQRDSKLDLGAVYHHRHSDRALFHASLAGTWGHDLDLDHQVLLGGDNGLRGYPLRYQGGESSTLLTLEERLFTDWYPFHLVHIGGALFFDMGRTWGGNPVGGENLGWLKDVGFGLRFGNSRSGIGRVVHLDFAFPLDGDPGIDSLQVLFKGKASF